MKFIPQKLFTLYKRENKYIERVENDNEDKKKNKIISKSDKSV